MMIIFLIDFNVIPLVYFKDGRCANMDDILPDGYRVKNGDGVYYMAYAMDALYLRRRCRGISVQKMAKEWNLSI